jgi:hypothetical protein
MNDTSIPSPDRQLRFIQELLDENVPIAGDITEIDAETWAIHGLIPMDGDVIVAEYHSYSEARGVLDEISISPPFA